MPVSIVVLIVSGENLKGIGRELRAILAIALVFFVELGRAAASVEANLHGARVSRLYVPLAVAILLVGAEDFNGILELVATVVTVAATFSGSFLRSSGDRLLRHGGLHCRVHSSIILSRSLGTSSLCDFLFASRLNNLLEILHVFSLLLLVLCLFLELLRNHLSSRGRGLSLLLVLLGLFDLLDSLDSLFGTLSILRILCFLGDLLDALLSIITRAAAAR